MRSCMLILFALVAGCSSEQAVPGRPAPDVTQAPAPWQSNTLSASEVPSVYLSEWRKAENRTSCALVAFTPSAVEGGAKPRAATFSGGWSVAYDLPQQRSAFGIAGAGVSASEPSYHNWPFKRSWADGSEVGYGPEGGTGPRQLGYLRIAGQDCLYNVWSQLGRSHLESLLDAIRFVATQN